jgi:hypothetical protein
MARDGPQRHGGERETLNKIERNVVYVKKRSLHGLS